VSEDTDILVFGATNLIRGYNASCPTVTVYNLQKILQQLDVTMEQLIDIGILLGCDYTTKIPNLGPKKILQEIKKYNNIEGIIQSKKYIIPESFQYERARQHFQHPQLITEPLQWNIKSPDDTVRVLHNYGIDDYDTERLVQAMMLHMEVNMDSDSD
jgi:flap endonuclease-1